MATEAGTPAFIDPAVCWMWAETDLGMALGQGGTLTVSITLQRDSATPRWLARARELLNLRELLNVVAHFGAIWSAPAQIEQAVRRFVGGSPG